MLYDLPAPAKLNLFLHVVGRRADGYHLLQTVFRLIDLADRIDLDVRPDGKIVRETDMLGVPHDEDLVVRAARALQAQTGTKHGAQIRVKKNIPAGGGLGGGGVGLGLGATVSSARSSSIPPSARAPPGRRRTTVWP